MSTETQLRVFHIEPYEERGSYVAAPTDEVLKRYADDYYGEGEWDRRDQFWACVVPYPDGYESREEWEQSDDFTPEWWESCIAPQDGRETENVRRFTHIEWRPTDG